MQTRITVILADDHAMVRGALAKLIMAEPDIQVVGEAESADGAVALAIEHEPAVVILDIDMPGRTAFDAARVIRSRAPKTAIVFLSAFTHDRYIEAALASGASAYITKGEPIETVLSAVRIAARGGTHFSAQIRDRIILDVTGPRLMANFSTRTDTLTPRELEVLAHLARGLSKKEIADVMTLSVGTVNNHAANLMAKLGIHDRVELARFAIREGIVEA
ncbi:MAG: response regulator transcription factor [Phycisphaerales bacterium]|nr:response regulator transcription factor [Phycisphaerales bacterium]